MKALKIIMLILFFPLFIFAQEKAKPRKGEGITLFLKRFKRTETHHYNQFIKLNKNQLGKNNTLIIGREYLLPPLKKEGYEPLFGKQYAKYPIESNELDGASFYLVSGHGGPDPGAIGKHEGRELHEDEYAYDIVLRLARCLLMKGATVHIIIQDAQDGIRNSRFLANSKQETCMGNRIPLNQVERLRQRCNQINKIYRHDKASYRRALFVHLDSRSKRQQTDVFFYHSETSTKGKHLASTLRETFDKKYDKHQPSRGFSGTLSARGLYVLQHTQPASVFVELGNIQNKRDQQRFMIEDNRQALANWICEGFIRDYKYYSKKK